MNLEIRLIPLSEENLVPFWPLLLLADPSKDMVNQYLPQGELYGLYQGDLLVAEAVILPLSPTLCELKNLAVREELHGQGLGSALVKGLFQICGKRFSHMQVGTSDSGVPFYEKLGFSLSHRIENFFVDHYPEPIYENGKQCVDMIYLSCPLKPEKDSE